MSERFLNNPHIPENKVISAFANTDDFALKKALDEQAIKVVGVAQNPFLDAPVSKHADILADYIGKSVFLTDKYQDELCEFVKNLGGKSIKINNIRSPYPNDCLLNFADIGDYIVCNKAIMSKDILRHLPNKEIIDVNQGYAKCSVCICKRNTVITDDISIFNALSGYGNVISLLVEKGSIAIKKYNYGFIGGCCGLIDKNLLLFNGDLSTHIDFKKIQKFLYDNGISYIDIKNKPLTDIGGIIPITEKDGD